MMRVLSLLVLGTSLLGMVSNAVRVDDDFSSDDSYVSRGDKGPGEASQGGEGAAAAQQQQEQEQEEEQDQAAKLTQQAQNEDTALKQAAEEVQEAARLVGKAQKHAEHQAKKDDAIFTGALVMQEKMHTAHNIARKDADVIDGREKQYHMLRDQNYDDLTKACDFEKEAKAAVPAAQQLDDESATMVTQHRDLVTEGRANRAEALVSKSIAAAQVDVSHVTYDGAQEIYQREAKTNEEMAQKDRESTDKAAVTEEQVEHAKDTFVAADALAHKKEDAEHHAQLVYDAEMENVAKANADSAAADAKYTHYEKQANEKADVSESATQAYEKANEQANGGGNTPNV